MLHLAFHLLLGIVQHFYCFDCFIPKTFLLYLLCLNISIDSKGTKAFFLEVLLSWFISDQQAEEDGHALNRQEWNSHLSRVNQSYNSCQQKTESEDVVQLGEGNQVWDHKIPTLNSLVGPLNCWTDFFLSSSCHNFRSKHHKSCNWGQDGESFFSVELPFSSNIVSYCNQNIVCKLYSIIWNLKARIGQFDFSNKNWIHFSSDPNSYFCRIGVCVCF